MLNLRKIAVAARRTDFTWRYLYNLAPSVAYRVKADGLAPELRAILGRLNRDGIVVTSVSELLGAATLFDELDATVAAREQELAPSLADARRHVDEAGPTGEKKFIYELLGPLPELDTTSVYARFALQDRLLAVVNAYFGMFVRLREYNVWRTFACASAPRQSQLWHRDREDRLILKMFVYLNDIPEGGGPFTYAPGTHQKGPIRATPEFFDEGRVQRSTDDQMAKVVASDRWIKAVGQKGTIVLADTRGYHKGGLARTSDRLMYLAMFTSPASESRELLARTATDYRAPDLARAVALAGPRRRFWLTLPNPSGRN
jgi:hypothetical protein